jgi:aconitate hydratase
MSPEFGCTVTYFPIDDQTLAYMDKTNRSKDQIELVEKYCKANKLWREDEDKINYSHVLELDLSTVVPTVSGPKRPQDKIVVSEFHDKFKDLLKTEHGRDYVAPNDRQVSTWYAEGGAQMNKQSQGGGEDVVVEEKSNNGLKTVSIETKDGEYDLSDGSIAIAAITSCTNTSNPSVMIGAGLVAKKAVERGIDVKPWVKTSLAPGSKVVTDYLRKANLLGDLEALRFHLVGYGCTSCIGNSGPLPADISKAVEESDLVVASVLSGNRNFEARVHPQVKMNFLMSPMLVVAYALAGRVDIDLNNDALGYDANNEPVYLKDVWPSNDEINEVMSKVLSPESYDKNYGEIFEGNEQWKSMQAPENEDYEWDDNSTYIKEAPFFKNLSVDAKEAKDIEDAYVLLKLGDSITTDHISPAGAFAEASAAGQYLKGRGVERKDFNSYGSRRGNDEVMVRGTFANVRIKNQLATQEGGYSTHIPSGEEATVYETASKYMENDTPTIVLAGKEYGSGSSRDWAAKGTYLLGIKAVIAESYERIHRSNLVGMGVLPLQYESGDTADSLGLDGTEQFTITGISDGLSVGKKLDVIAKSKEGKETKFKVLCRLDSGIEIEYYKNEGILQYVLRQFLKE